MRAGFERALKRCRTREDVQRLRLSLAGQEKGRVEALDSVLRQFVKRGDYARFPTEAEEAKTFRAMQESCAAGEETPPPSDRLIERYKHACVE